MNKRLVLIGCGHAHLSVLVKLDDFVKKGHSVAVVSCSSHQYYSGMGPGMLAGIYQPREVRFHVKKMVEDRGALFIEDEVIRVDPVRRTLMLASGNPLEYDIASFNTGSAIPVESLAAPDERLISVKPILNLYKARLAILRQNKNKELKIIVIGGGAAGVEISANVWRLLHDNDRRGEVTLISGERILSGYPTRVRRLAMQSLESRGIRVLEGVRVRSVAAGTAVLSDGSSLIHDFAFVASGVKPSSLFRGSGLPVGEDGGLLVDSHLRSVAHPELFGGGDCIGLVGHALAKVGVYAVRQGPILHWNLTAALEGGGMKTFNADRPYMLILNLGDGRGILWKNNWVLDGRIAFILKNSIDKRFMRKFQVSGELTEPTEG